VQKLGGVPRSDLLLHDTPLAQVKNFLREALVACLGRSRGAGRLGAKRLPVARAWRRSGAGWVGDPRETLLGSRAGTRENHARKNAARSPEAGQNSLPALTMPSLQSAGALSGKTRLCRTCGVKVAVPSATVKKF